MTDAERALDLDVAALTSGEVAEKLGLNEGTVRRWLAAGKMPGRKVGGMWLVSPRRLRDWLDGRDSEGGRGVGYTDETIEGPRDHRRVPTDADDPDAPRVHRVGRRPNDARLRTNRSLRPGALHVPGDVGADERSVTTALQRVVRAGLAPDDVRQSLDETLLREVRNLGSRGLARVRAALDEALG